MNTVLDPKYVGCRLQLTMLLREKFFFNGDLSGASLLLLYILSCRT